jgi:hypothetical protein
MSMKTVAAWCLALLFASGAKAQTYSCVPNNRVATFPYSSLDTTGHLAGYLHNWASSQTAFCHYSGSNRSIPCTISASAQSTTLKADTGHVQWIGYHHEVNTSTSGGAAASNGPTISVDTEAAVVANTCLISCAATPTISGTGLGGGFSVSYPPSNIWSDKQHFAITCAGPLYPEDISACSGTTNGGDTLPPPRNPCGPSPLVVSTKRGKDARKAFSNAAEHCVRFDMANDGNPRCWAWPERDSGVGFVVYDVDGDHDIGNGGEFFGTYSPHADYGVEIAGMPSEKNPDSQGFRALTWQKMSQGGGQDLEVTPKDGKLYPRLRVWFPDHCWDNPDQPCVSQKSEMRTLESLGIKSIGLMYGFSHDCDGHGTCFKYYSQLNPQPHDLLLPADPTNERRVWDAYPASVP